MDRFGERTGRRYSIVDYTGHPEAERVLVLMGSGAETVAGDRGRARRRGRAGRRGAGAAVPAVPGRRRCSTRCPRRVRADRRAGPHQGARLDRRAAVPGRGRRARRGARRRRATVMPRVIGGRYGLSSKEFTPGMVAGRVRRARRERPRRRFTVGINDDVTGTSLDLRPVASTSSRPTPSARSSSASGRTARSARTRTRSRSWAPRSDLHAQGYFVYDSKKSGSQTVSHLRFGPRADPRALPGAAAPASSAAISSGCSSRSTCSAAPRPARRCCSTAGIRRTRSGTRCRGRSRSRSSPSGSRCTRSTPAGSPARSGSPGGSTSSCRPASSPSPACCPASEAIARIKAAIAKTYGRRGAEVVERNDAAVDGALDGLHRIEVPDRGDRHPRTAAAGARARAGVRPHRDRRDDGRPRRRRCRSARCRWTAPTRAAPTAYEKRNISELVAVWDSDLCIQCGNCSFVCPHSVIRSKYYDQSAAGRGAGRSSGRRRWTPPACRTPATRCRSTSRTAPGAGCASRPARSRRPATRSRKAINLAPARAAGGRRAREHRVLRDAAGERPVPGGLRHRARHPVPASRCSSSPAPAPAAARRRTSSCCRSCSATG